MTQLFFFNHGIQSPQKKLVGRINYTGTNRGDVIYGVKMPSFDSIWRMTVGEKKLLFGKHRVPVGGQAPEGTEPEGGNIEQKQLKPVQTFFFCVQGYLFPHLCFVGSQDADQTPAKSPPFTMQDHGHWMKSSFMTSQLVGSMT